MAAGDSGELTPSDWTIIHTMIVVDALRARLPSLE
jgi:hypothetical protein